MSSLKLLLISSCTLLLCLVDYCPAVESLAEPLLDHQLYVNHQCSTKSISRETVEKINRFMATVSDSSQKSSDLGFEFYHILKSVNHSAGEITLLDDSVWNIGLWYTGVIKDWNPGDQLRISFHRENYNNNIQIENVDSLGIAWGTMKFLPNLRYQDRITDISFDTQEGDAVGTVKLRSGLVFSFYPRYLLNTQNWSLNDRIFVFHNNEGGIGYDLWNLDKNNVILNLFYRQHILETVEEQEEKFYKECIYFDQVLTLESKLNQYVLAQEEATKALATTIINYCAGLKDSNTPIGVFLFLGPTGIGKTELAKVLAEQLYGSQNNLIRIDMSHFCESHGLTRLIGSPPGYVNHDEGGQLTNALKNKPCSVVLLDEMEKAHDTIQKVFLPVFDEGYITDSKNKLISCRNVIFIMTSNICSSKITSLFNQGLSHEDVLQAIEPKVIEALSPELYNRVQPIVFRPLSEEVMGQLVDLMLGRIVNRLKSTKEINLILDDSVREYLVIHGYHPTLGARPLKKLIEKKVVASISYALIAEAIPDGSTVRLTYNVDNDSWHVNWKNEEIGINNAN